MRITLLSCAVLALTTTAAAQTAQVEPWQPRTTIGVGLGQFASLFSTSRPTNVLDSTALARVLAQEPVDVFRPIRSITVEIPLSGSGRIRIEGSRTAMPIVPRGRWEASTQADTAHLQRLTISAVRLWQPGEPVLPYVGLGVGLQRARFDVAPESQRGVVGYLHFGVDVRVSDRLTLGAEAGLSGTGKDPWFHQAELTGEGVFRLKVGL